ncbi:MAG: bifunctional (p)ppGpp synthetase/guanosine-3',5'-bis(diphosphate) 3'-pyrophosphohydrolase [Proteobacteria bacterium]|nr:bifunctional (p)ppGpp synthetase/guanosine-3',5'-bis(diphosphate) 3'-pyrophosphohydrolase [Pseudomonadota bacterium]
MDAPVPALLRVLRAADFAARLHRDQRRKGEAREPYVNHLIDVACRVARASAGEDPVVVIAALLHDVVEDTPAGLADVAAAFGEEVAAVVAELSDDPALAKAERKRRQAEAAPGASGRAKMLRIADKISNLQSLIDSPPMNWDLARRIDYAHWAKAVVDGCRGDNPSLEAEFDETYAQAMACLERAAALAER